MNDEEMNRSLSEWQVEIPDDPHFRSAVWREIAMRDAETPLNRLREAFDRFLRPRLAIPLGATALLFTALLAGYHGLQSRENKWEALSHSYSQSIDPVAHLDSLSGRTAPD